MENPLHLDNHNLDSYKELTEKPISPRKNTLRNRLLTNLKQSISYKYLDSIDREYLNFPAEKPANKPTKREY